MSNDTVTGAPCTVPDCPSLAVLTANLDTAGGLETSWLLLCTFLVISMQLGFAMLEVGSVREAHRMTVLAKNVLDSAVSCLVFAVASGRGLWESSLVLDADGFKMYDMQLYHWAFCATCVTICSGSMAERTHIIGYLTHASLMAGLIFPPIAEAVWGRDTGFMRKVMMDIMQKDYYYHDCAGSGVVHLVGGTAALAGNLLLGRRIMRSDEAEHGELLEQLASENKLKDPENPRSEQEFLESRRPSGELSPPGAGPSRWLRRFDNAERDKREFQPCNYLQVMGMFILWVGWYGFNTGGSLSASRGGAHSAGLVAWNTTIAAAAGGFGSYLYLYGFHLNLDIGFLCNGMLSGLVSITACCDVAQPLASLIIGLISGAVIYPTASSLMRRLRLDDPVDAVPVHAAAGFFGVLAVALCRPDCEAFARAGPLNEVQQHFCREDYDMGLQMVEQLWGCVVIVLWTFVISYTFWLLLATAESLRALELEQVNQAEKLLEQLSGNPNQDPDIKSQVNEGLVGVAELSRTVRKALKQHGWNGRAFLTGHPQDLMSLLDKLRQAQISSLDTALETEVCRALRFLVRLSKSCWICRELAVARLRIHPWAEISGLGAAETSGGRLYLAIQHAAGQVAELRQQASAEPLQNEVRELSMLVRSQDVLLRRLMNRRYAGLSSSSSPGRRLHRVPEEQLGRAQVAHERPEPTSPSSAAVSPESSPACCRQADEDLSQPSTARSLRSGSRAAWSDARDSYSSAPGFRLDLRSETASTVSEASMGALSPHSANSSTPPPTVHHRLLRPPSAPPNPNVMNVAEQLVQMLQVQQQLLSTIGAPQLPPNETPHQGLPPSPSAESQPLMQQAALLCAALQQVADSSPSVASSSRRTTQSEL